jgi:hypothetical protein
MFDRPDFDLAFEIKRPMPPVEAVNDPLATAYYVCWVYNALENVADESTLSGQHSWIPVIRHQRRCWGYGNRSANWLPNLPYSAELQL